MPTTPKEHFDSLPKCERCNGHQSVTIKDDNSGYGKIIKCPDCVGSGLDLEKLYNAKRLAKKSYSPYIGCCPVCGTEYFKSKDRSMDGFTVCVNNHRMKSNNWTDKRINKFLQDD